jgi:hypothetical protein
MVKGIVAWVCCGVMALSGAAAMEDEAMDECCTTAPEKTASLTAEAPIACTLTDAAKRERRDEIAGLLSEAAKSTREIEDGYVVEFEDGHTAKIVEFIEFERTCCSFLEFTLTFAPKNGPVTLSITGPEGTKDFLKDVFVPASS